MALTRAKYGLVLIGNPRVLAKDALWNALLAHFKECGCLVEGPLTNLRQSAIQLPQPKKARPPLHLYLVRFNKSRFVWQNDSHRKEGQTYPSNVSLHALPGRALLVCKMAFFAIRAEVSLGLAYAR